MLQLNNFKAWVQVDGVPVPGYGMEVNQTENSIRCWIASEEGKNFEVHWSDEIHRVPSCGRVYLDGHKAGGVIILPHTSSGHAVVRSVPLDATTSASLQFGKLAVTDDDTMAVYDEKFVKALGSIELKIVTGRPRAPRAQPKYPALPGHLVHEKMKKAGSHRVVLGEKQKVAASHGAGFKGDGLPPIRFIFQYQSRDLLQAREIMPLDAPAVRLMDRSSNLPLKSEHDLGDHEDDSASEDQIRQLEAQLEALKNRPKKRPSDGEDGTKAKKTKVEQIEAKLFFQPGEIIDLT